MLKLSYILLLNCYHSFEVQRILFQLTCLLAQEDLSVLPQINYSLPVRQLCRITEMGVGAKVFIFLEGMDRLHTRLVGLGWVILLVPNLLLH